jgi:hypothetical protein
MARICIGVLELDMPKLPVVFDFWETRAVVRRRGEEDSGKLCYEEGGRACGVLVQVPLGGQATFQSQFWALRSAWNFCNDDHSACEYKAIWDSTLVLGHCDDLPVI